MFEQLVKQSRSVRRFDANIAVTEEQLKYLVSLVRFVPSAGNAQPLKYIISTGASNNRIFETLSWAAYLKDWNGPEISERPTGYIVILNDTSINRNCLIDVGISAQTILLGAMEKGISGCMIKNYDSADLSEVLGLDNTNLEIMLVIALGKGNEEIVIDNAVNNKIEYWRDENSVHHVPKRSLDELIYKII